MFASFWSSWFGSATSRKSNRKLGRRLAARSRFFRRPARVERLEERALLVADLDLTKTFTFAAGGDVNGGGTFNPGDTILYTVTVANVGDVDLTGVTFDDLIDANTTLGQVNVSPLARNDSFNAVGNTRLRVGGVAGPVTEPEVFVAGGSVLNNDSEFLSDLFTLTPIVNGTTALGGTVDLLADGTFTYISQAGDTGTDSFTYTIQDDGFDGIAGNADDLSGIGTVSIVLTGKIWYVDGAFGGTSDGRSTNPFKLLADVSGASGPDLAGDTIFVHDGNYTGGITLLNNQTLWGQGSALTATLPAGTPSGLVTLLAAGSDPTITNAAGNGVTLASGNTLRGFTVGDTSAYDIANTTTATVGTLTITNVDLIGTGGLFRADSGGVLNVTLDTATSTSTGAGIHGIQLSGGPTGSFTATTGAISGGSATGTDVLISGGSETVSIGSSITSSAGGSIDIGSHVANNVTLSGALNITGGTGISVHNNTGGTIAFTNASKTVSTGASNAIDLDTNTGATVNFTGGGLDIDTTTGTGFDATSGGTISVTGSSNSINDTGAVATHSGTALNVNGVSIGSGGLNFVSITSGAGANVGISLVNTGTAAGNGGLTVSGTGTAASGGTISGKTGANGSTTAGIGINLENTKNPSFTRMQLNDHQNFAIRASDVDGFTLQNSVINGNNGNDAGSDEGAILFLNGSGTITIASNSISGGFEDNVRVLYDSATADTAIYNVTANTFSDLQSGNNALVNLRSATTASSSSNVTFNFGSTSNAALGNMFDNSANQNPLPPPDTQWFGDGILVTFEGPFQHTINIDKNTFFELFQAIDYAAGFSADVDGRIYDNTITFTEGVGAIAFGTASTSTASMLFQMLIEDNDIGGLGNDSGSRLGSGIVGDFRGAETARVTLHQNVVRDTEVNPINFISQATTDGDLHLRITNNTVASIDDDEGGGAGVIPGINVTTNAATNGDIFLTISGNTSTGINEDGILVRQATVNNTYALEDFAGNGTIAADVDAYLEAQNPGTTARVRTGGSVVNYTSKNDNFTDTPAPLTPLLFAPSEPPLVQSPAEGTPVVPAPVVETPVDRPSVDSQPLVIVDDGVLSQVELDSLVGAAIARWEATGLTAEQSAALRSVTFSIEDLPGWYLGAAGAGHVTLDVNAAGNSWFVDPTPEEDSEFESMASGALIARNATEGVPYSADGRVDALTTVMHELGHHLGLEDSYVRTDSGNLMYGFIHLSERRLPAAGQAEGAVPHLAGSGVEYANVPVVIGSLPIGKSVQILFTAQINLNNTAATITNQGSAFSDQGGAAGTMASPILSNTTTINVDFPDVTVALGATTSVAEDSGGNLVYTFTREAPLTNALTVNFTVAGGAVFTGDATTDYTQTGAATFGATSGTVTFAAGSSTAIVTITPMADTTVEPDETVVLTVASGAGYDVGVPSAATGTIVNDDTSVKVELLGGTSVSEDGTTNLVYTFTRAGVTTNSLTVNFSATGTASAASDYGLTATTFIPGTGLGTVVFGANVTTVTATLDPTADNDVEGDESAVLTVLAGAGYNVGSPNAATGTITNDDATVTVTVSPSSVAEDGAGTLVYTFTRSGFTTGTLSVSYQASGTATGFGGGTIDYNVSGGGAGSTFSGGAAGTGAGILVFDAGDLTEQVVVDPIDDATAEGDETVVFTVNANGAPATTGGYTVGVPGAATGTILEDDTNVTVVVSPTSVDEDSSAGTMVYTFTRTGATTNPLTVSFTVGGTAVFTADASTDYTQSGATTFNATTGTVVIAAGSATATVTLDPQADSAVEPDETAVLTVVAASGYAPGVPAAATGTILNDDTDVSVGVSPGSVNEDGTTNLVYTFTRTGVTTNVLTVNFDATGTASAASDYGLTATTFIPGTGLGTVVFAANVTTATATVDPTADNDVEGDESAVLTVLAGTGYNVGSPSAATGTIANDDATVTVLVSPSSTPEDGVGTLVYTFTRSGFTTGTLSVSYQASGTAIGFGAGTIDYTVSGGGAGSSFDGGAAGTGAGVLVFDAGDLTEQVVVDPIDDMDGEQDETVIFTINANGAPATTGGYAVGAPGAATGTISNDDTAVSVSVSPTPVPETGATSMVYTFTRTGDNSAALAINFSAGGTTSFTNDYSITGADSFSTATGLGTATFAAGSSTAAITLTPTDDTRVEGSETAAIAVESGAGYGVGTSPAVGTITDNDTATIAFAVATSNAPEGTTPHSVGVSLVITGNGVAGTGTLERNVSVNVQDLLTGSATAGGVDYTFTTPTTVTFLSGDASSTKNATLAIVNDTDSEGDETINLQLNTLTDGTGGQANIGAGTSHVVTIVDNDVDLTITKTDGQASAVPGTPISYTIVVTNAGQLSASGASVMDTFPASLTNVTFQVSASGGATGFTASGSGNINDTTITMPIGSTITYVVTGTISASATGVLSNTATVSGPAGLTESTPANNTATDNSTLTPSADLLVVKSGAASVAADSNLTYTITVTNNGPSDAQSVSLSDVLPAGTTFLSETHPGGFVATTPPVNTNGTVSYAGGTLASGAAVTFTIAVHADAGLVQGALLSNTATASAATNDPTAGNNDSTLVTTVNNLDFGDAPVSYATLLVGDGARHRLGSGLFLGASIDAEVDGQPNATATGDDSSGIDDENGVTLPGTIVAGLGATATVVASAAGKLDAWIDFNGNGVFDASEQIATNLQLVAGINHVTFTAPVTAFGGVSFARFRLSSAGGLAPTGQATDGEVEDYAVQIAALVPGSASIVADPQNPGQFLLQVVGTSQGDVLIIEPRPSNRTQIRVRKSGAVLGIFPSSAFQRIVAFGLDGNDTIIVDSRIAKPAELHGNNGNDTLKGGSRNDVLFGENGNDNLHGNAGHDTLFGGQGNDNLFGATGNDRVFGEAGNDSLFGDSGNDLLLGGADNDKLNGGTGRDVLIGGLGQDKLFAQQNDDILIGGTTSHDNNDAALNSIMAEWTSGNGFNTRIANLGGLLNSGTVQDDGRRDTLDGDGRRNWYLDFLLADTINGFDSNPTNGDKKN